MMVLQSNARRWGRTKITSWIAMLSFILTAVLPLTALAGDTVFYYHNDATGSPVAVTNSVGTKVWGADYEPFGELAGVVETVPNNQQFLAKTVDPETSLHLLGARYYDGKIGRFLSVDAGLLHGQQAAMLGRSQFHNVYAYSANNPYRFFDPTGDTPIDVVFLAIDVASLGVAVYTGVGIASAVVDVGLSAAGVISPVPGVGEVLKAGRAVGHVAGIVKGAEKTAGGARVLENARQGEAFEKQVLGELQKSQTGLVQQLTVKTESGIRTKLDIVGRDSSGAIKCTECKSSATAPLTKAQKAGFPEIGKTGAVVLGKGKSGFPGGTIIPPTKIDIVRP
jgi:RHS repeat-associated protein